PITPAVERRYAVSTTQFDRQVVDLHHQAVGRIDRDLKLLPARVVLLSLKLESNVGAVVKLGEVLQLNCHCRERRKVAVREQNSHERASGVDFLFVEAFPYSARP